MTDATNAIPVSPPPSAYAPVTVTGALGKPRSSLAVILLSIITLGIYALYWEYKTFQEMKDNSGQGVGGDIGLILDLFVGFIAMVLMSSEDGYVYERACR